MPVPPPGPLPGPRIDERVLGAGTSVRFATLLFLMLTAGGSMALAVYRGVSDGDIAGCDLAAGVDPHDSGFWARAVSITGQSVAYRWCVSYWAPAPPWWQVVGWPLLLIVSAGLLFHLLPLWKARRTRVVPLESVDPDGELRALLGELTAATGVTPAPRVVVDPAALSTGAVVFGRTRRPVVCLHGGLLATRRSDPERFWTVLLHELAHIANRDVTLTYATVALSRVFLVLVLLPYVIWQGHWMYGFLAAGMLPPLDRVTLLAAVMVALVYLARSDTLRSREIYADLTAARWGADPHAWAATATRPDGTARRALDSFLELWRTHPRWGLRRGALADPAPLFRAAALPVFLTGTMAVLAPWHLMYQLAPYRADATSSVFQAIVLIPAALVAGVAGTALWRAVVYAVLTGTRVPSGIRAGAWLGAGMAAGTVLNGYGTGWAWLPVRPQVLLIPVVAGAAFGWWTTRCAHLWASTWRGRTLRPALLLGLVAAFLAMASWLLWWMASGTVWAGGFTVSAEGMARSVLEWLPSAAPAGDLSGQPGITTVLPLLQSVAFSPLSALSAAALWVVPLLAWAAGPVRGTVRWTAAPPPPSGDPVAPLRRVMLPGLVGGALACLAVAGVQAYVHTGQPAPDGRGGLYALRYAGMVLLALVVPSALAAAVASAVTGRFRLLGSLIAAQTATLLGLVAMTVLVSVDGCAGPLTVLHDSCAWRPAWRQPLFPFVFLLDNAVVLATLTAGAAAALATLLHRARPHRSRPSGSRRAGPRRGTLVPSPRTRLLAVGLLCAAAVAASAATGVYQFHVLGLVNDLADGQRKVTQMASVPDRPVSPGTRLDQVHAWYHLGGYDALELIVSYTGQLTEVVREAKDARPALSWDRLDERLRPVCTRWSGAERLEVVWFRVPDSGAQADWHAMAVRAGRGGRLCAQALDARDQPRLLTALRDLIAAGRCASSANARIDTMLRDGGLRGTIRPPVKGARAICDRAVDGLPTPAGR
ncbi:M48 family metalloprotease [Streptomyces sp. NRRL S-118]|uniref:M48 family metalloprotease n=1 Tax=Streptomyces sp. NRRL S-118 TaxID=1463881 RepID=UPI0004C7EFA4|nr:M48 family metalloprotease [Streptomyces sp. NRRL S-118]